MRIFTVLFITLLLGFSAVQAQGLILNGTFDDSTGAWVTEQYNGAEFTWHITDGVAQIIMDVQGANSWDPQFKQIIAVETGWQYDISFDLYTSMDSAVINVWVQENHGPDYLILYGMNATAKKQWQTFSFTTDEIEVDDANAKLTFVLGSLNPGDTLLIDNVYMDYSDGTSAIAGNKTEYPAHFSLEQNYPNPFNPETNIQFTLVKSGFTSLQVFNALGQLVETLLNRNMSAGEYTVKFNAQNYPSGIYYYKINSAGLTDAKKMVLIK